MNKILEGILIGIGVLIALTFCYFACAAGIVFLSLVGGY